MPNLNVCSARFLHIACCLLFGVLAVSTGGCASTEPIEPGVPDEPPPDYTTIATVLNQQREPLSKLWTRVTVRVDGHDATGDRLSEQAEGTMQVIQPDRVSMSLGKLGKTYFQLGSNDERYWWFDLTDDRTKTATVGSHALVTQAKLDRFGVPVHPLELLDAIALTPLPLDGRGRTAWSTDGRYIGLLVPSESGERRVWVDPESLVPAFVQIYNTSGELLIETRVTEDRFEQVETPLGVEPTIPGRYKISVVGLDAVVTLDLWDPDTTRSIQPLLFDFDELVRRRGVDLVIDIDEPRGAGASGATVSSR